MIHRWAGVVFVRGVTVSDAVRLLQDYDRHAGIYAPAVARSKRLARDGQQFRVYLRFYTKKVIAVTLDSEHNARFTGPADGRASSRIHVSDAGKPNETKKAEGDGRGYMWRLNTYWRFAERDGGTWVQCESVTLSSRIPFGFGWLLKPFVTEVPKESLTFTLETTRKALLKNVR